MKQFTTILLFLLLLFSSCKVEIDIQPNINCKNLEFALISENDTLMSSEINGLTIDLFPNPIQGDKIGHSNNLDVLVDRLNNNCDNLIATVFCYACIKTDPPQSELIIEVDYDSIQIKKVIDIVTSDGRILKAVSMHD